MSLRAKIAHSLTCCPTFPLKRKFLLQTALVAVGIVALAVVAARMQYLDLNDTRKAGLTSATQMAVSVIEGYAKQVETGAMEEDAAKAAALAALATMQANEGVDYFFVTDDQPVMLMPPRLARASTWTTPSPRPSTLPTS